VGMLGDSDAFVRRAAADTLGQHPAAENLVPLLELWHNTPSEDTHRIHTTRISLRDTLAALPRLDDLALRFGAAKDRVRRLADVSLGIASPAAGDFLLAYLTSPA